MATQTYDEDFTLSGKDQGATKIQGILSEHHSKDTERKELFEIDLKCSEHEDDDEDDEVGGILESKNANRPGTQSEFVPINVCRDEHNNRNTNAISVAAIPVRPKATEKAISGEDRHSIKSQPLGTQQINNDAPKEVSKSPSSEVNDGPRSAKEGKSTTANSTSG